MTKPLNWIIRTDEPFHGVSQSFTYLDDNGIERVAYTDFTLEEYAQERKYPFKLINSDELDILTDDYIKGMKTKPEETSEEKYFYALEVLPPCRFNGNIFHVSERIYGDIVSWYFRKNDKFYHFNNISSLTHDELKAIIERT